MSCKYCFQTDHTIEQCKTILCRVCKEIGHPHWLCNKEKKNVKKTVSKPMITISKQNEKPIESNHSSPKQIQIPVSIGSETKRDIHFYMKQSQRKWSDIL
jgi:hypothetical protein